MHRSLCARLIIIHPYPGDWLTYVRAEYDSVHGKITSYWKIENGIFTLGITIPANTTARVYVPASDKDEVTEGGMLAEQTAGVTFLHREGDRVVFEVESGTYEFQCKIGNPN